MFVRVLLYEELLTCPSKHVSDFVANFASHHEIRHVTNLDTPRL
jgi:hypothetical protein